MDICPVAQLPVTSNSGWDTPHVSASYTTIFKGIGDRIVYCEAVPRNPGELVMLDYIDEREYISVIEELGMKDKSICTIVNLHAARDASYQYKQDFANIAYNWGPKQKVIVLCNVTQSMKITAETFSAIAPQHLPLVVVDTYEDAVNLAKRCLDEEQDCHDVLQPKTVYEQQKKTFLAALARMSWFNLFCCPVQLPEYHSHFFAYLKSAALLNDDLERRRSNHQKALQGIREKNRRTVEERTQQLNLQRAMNRNLQKTVQQKKAELTARLAAVELEVTRVSTAAAEKNGLLARLYRDLAAQELPPLTRQKLEKLCSRINPVPSPSRENDYGLSQQDTDFLSRLHRLHPGLNQRELRICLLIRNNLNTREIATSLGITPRGVESVRYRLHKKLGLQKHCTIKNYLSTTAALL
ncbi:hypothetical protein INT08_00150 [Prosthecochloris sp. N3]|uniref:HTH luxR-type domain-containing protein n=1 Tax=Prosthecochloris ethylica TaxID=2743976 RepID=A0ABR9XP58_9CHLB|nr:MULTISPECIES: hypothetical protein [Prosthecochloris]MBF0585681.1 hypothetical protein [Prosthecochloris ethylica]MBF0635591.1 hypothetical protein [Prosthecochloris ethylica]NUK46890.1 hypothetical protein [Prosthecochloris ethylica]RNA65389.1 hypothetical protein CR163_009285 [Prosthecochloris sp. ZM_2]